MKMFIKNNLKNVTYFILKVLSLSIRGVISIFFPDVRNSRLVNSDISTGHKKKKKII
jgi:hypothetical protein